MKQPTPTQSDSIRDRVFATIDEQNVVPRPCYVFWCQNSLMWLLWLVTVLFGALATAVLWFTSTYRYYDIYEAMHDNFVTFFLQALPLLWIGAFIALMVVAMQGLRATRRGYRLSPALVGGSSVGVSVLLGAIASGLGFGYLVDSTLGHYAPMYYSLAEREEQLWLQPDQGRLVGHTTAQTAPEITQITFTDVAGTNWTMHITELSPFDKELLRSQLRVRVLGARLSAQTLDFHACGVFPWMMNKNWPIKELSQQRQVAIERIYGHKDDQKGRVDRLKQEVFDDSATSTTTTTTDSSECAKIAAVRRISEQME